MGEVFGYVFENLNKEGESIPVPGPLVGVGDDVITGAGTEALCFFVLVFFFLGTKAVTIKVEAVTEAGGDEIED